jgi:hypothetical protein
MFAALGIALVGAAAQPAAGQGLRVAVDVRTPHVSARVAVGRRAHRAYRMVPHPASVWVTDPYLARLHRQHTRWVAREWARLEAMRYHGRHYRQAVRAFERERAWRERELERAYDQWLRERERARREQERWRRHGHRR